MSPDTGYYREFIYIILLNVQLSSVWFWFVFLWPRVSRRALHVFIGCLSFLWIDSSYLQRSYLCTCWLVQMFYIFIILNIAGNHVWLFILSLFSCCLKFLLLKNNFNVVKLTIFWTFECVFGGLVKGKFYLHEGPRNLALTSLCFNVISWRGFQGFPHTFL